MSKRNRKTRRVLRGLATVLLVFVAAYCCVRIADITRQYRREASLHASLMASKPVPAQAQRLFEASPGALSDAPHGARADALSVPPPGASTDGYADTPPGTRTDALTDAQSALTGAPPDLPPGAVTEISWLDALRARNAQVVGWLTIPGTAVDYPFVQGRDNEVYLDRDFDGDPAAAGTLFLDARSDAAFGDFNTLLYGHNMKNGSMFGELDRFSGEAFFAEHQEAMLYLADARYTLDIVAFLFVTADNAMMYDTLRLAPASRAQYLAYVAKNARRCRDLGLTEEDRFVTLSTCTRGARDVRSVLIARIRRAPEAAR